jgi:hypothetical protein
MIGAQKLTTPGPGHYDDGRLLEQQVMRKTLGKPGTFGCTEKRFAPKPGQTMMSAIETPGPGTYIQPNLQTMKQEEIKRSSSMFISKTKRNGAYHMNVKRTKQNPGLERVCYDDKVNTIGETVRRRVEQINNPLLASLTSKNNTTMAFSTNAPRFNQKVQDEETYIGPGYYEQKSCFEKSRSTLAGTKAKTDASTSKLTGARSYQQILGQ